MWHAKIQASVVVDHENEGFFKATVTTESFTQDCHQATAQARSVDRALAFALRKLADGLALESVLRR